MLKSEIVYLSCMAGPLNWRLTCVHRHTSQHHGKIWLCFQETFRAFKLITGFKNKSSKIHPYTRIWLHSVFIVPDMLNTRLDAHTQSHSPVGTTPKSTDLHLRKSTPDQFSGAAITHLLLAQYHSYRSHQERSCLMLMLVAAHIGWDSACWALTCYCWRQQ